MRFLRVFIQVGIIILFFAFSANALSPAQRGIKIKPVETEHFIFYFNNPEYINFADSILNSTRQKMILLLKDTLSYKPYVYLLDDLDQFNKLTYGKFPDWGAAAAYPERKLIAIKSPDHFNLNKSLNELLAHEYTHMAVAGKCGFYRPPRWINEGLAMYTSAEWSWSDNLAMGKAAVFGQLIPLKDIELVNRFNESKAHVAYSQSYMAVQFMLRQYGKNSVNLFLTQISLNKSIDQALLTATGSTYYEFENDYRLYLSKQFNYASLFMDTLFFWLALALIVIIAFFMRFKKRRQYYKKWEEEEKYHSTDFDYGDPSNPEQVDDDDDESWRK